MQKKSIKHLIVIVGPTASGKTELSIALAHALQCAILSADSRQFYQELSIGTAKPTENEMDGIRHYFINNLSIKNTYTAGQFESEAMQVLEKEFAQHNFAILVGGSGLYIDAVCKGIDDLPRSIAIRNDLNKEFEQFGIEKLQLELQEIDPQYYQQCDQQNPHRLIRAIEVYRASGLQMSELLSKTAKERPFKIHYFGIHHERDKLYERINLRVLNMIEIGLIKEVQSVLPYRHHQALNTVGYKEVFDYLDNTISLEEAIQQIQQNTRRYAKRQLTWFRREPATVWLNDTLSNNVQEIITLVKQTKNAD